MKYSTVIFSGNKYGCFTNMVEKQLNQHFNVWSSETLGSTFVFRWIKNAFVFETNSSVLFQKWITIDSQFFNYMREAITVEEEQNLSFSNVG